MKKISAFLVLFFVVILAFTNTRIPSENSQNGSDSLVAYFPFNGTANDESGKGNHGTVEGATLTQDRFGINGNAYSFDGTNDYITIADNPDLFSDEMTISWWYKLSEIPGGAAVVIGWVDGGHRYQQFFSGVQLNYFNGYNVGDPGMYFNPIIDLADLNEWKNVVVTYKKLSAATSKTSVYVDGELKQTDTHTLAMDYAQGINFLIGKNHNGNYFKGDFDDLRIFNRILDIGEIALLHNDSTTYFPTDTKLAAYFPFNGNANDVSGNNHHGSVSGATLTTDRFGNTNSAYNFNGSSDFIDIDHAATLNLHEYTYSAWINLSAYPPGINLQDAAGTILDIGGSSLDQYMYVVNYNPYFGISGSGYFAGGGSYDARTGFLPNLNQWYHVAVTRSNTSFKLFVDGLLIQTVPLTAAGPDYGISPLAVIGKRIGDLQYFAGKIDDIRIYDNPLTEARVKSLFQSESIGLVAYFPFNGNANDESGNGHDGTVYGGILTEDRNAKPDNAYTFPNLHDQIILANTANLNLQGGFTLNTWVKYKNINSGIVGKHNCWIPNGFLLGIEDGQFTLWISNGGWQIIKTNETYQEDKWYMVTAVYDSMNKTGLLYVDGKLKSIGYAVYSNFNAANLTISEASGGCPSGNMPGAIDEVKIYNRPLTAEEIHLEYNISLTGLVAFYPFNGDAKDVSGNGNNGTIIGTLTPTADRYGLDSKAYKFWQPDYISVPTNSSFFTNEFTVSYWYKVASYSGERGVLSCVGKNGGYQQYYTGTNFAYLMGYNFPHENSYFSSNYTVSDAPNTWHHVTATYQKTDENSSVSKFYVNGELKKTDTQPVAIAYPGEEKFNIGKNVDVNFNGELDDIRFYNKTLTDQEIKDLYLTETKPVLLNPANQSSVTTLTPEMLWSSPLVNAEFRFQLASDSLFGTILHELVTIDLKTQIPDALLTEGQNYYWRVRTTLDGETGPWSYVWSFNFVNTGLEKPIREDVSLRLSPNPADASTKIIYSLPETGINGAPVTVEIVNSIGKCIKKLTARNVSGGNNEAEVESGSLQSGIYYCRLKAGNIFIVRKLVIIH